MPPSTVSPGTTLYLFSALTRDLSNDDRVALASAVETVNEEIYNDKIGIQVRKNSLQKELSRITRRASTKGENKEGLEGWEEEVRKMFWEAGETDFAYDVLIGYLERVRQGFYDGRKMLKSWASEGQIKVSVLGSPCSTGYEIQLQRIRLEAHEFSRSIKQTIQQVRNQLLKEHYELMHKSYFDYLDKVFYRQVDNPTPQQALKHLDKLYRTIRVLRTLVHEEHVPFFTSFGVSPLYGILNLVERCNLWKPMVPDWFHPTSRLER